MQKLQLISGHNSTCTNLQCFLDQFFLNAETIMKKNCNIK